jgi:tripartite-type tricarboxylate transporter receptor subunit TctC
LVLAALAAAAMPHPARANAYPSKPIRMIVPWPAGGVADVVTRRTTVHLERVLGQPLVVENRAGAQGQVGAQHLSRAAPDGYTIGRMDNTCLVLAPAFTGQPLYDPLKDFTPISLHGRGFLVLLVSPSLGVDSLDQLVALARARPGELNYGAVAPGAGFLVTERFKQVTGTDIKLVAYKGDAPVLSDLIAGHIQLGFIYTSAAAGFVKSGKLKALLVTGEKRAPAIPEAPTAFEAGMPQLELYGWGGFMAPPGTPRPIVDRLAAATVLAMQAPDVQKALYDSGSENMAGTPEQFTAFLKADLEKWLPVIRSLNFRM